MFLAPASFNTHATLPPRGAVVNSEGNGALSTCSSANAPGPAPKATTQNAADKKANLPCFIRKAIFPRSATVSYTHPLAMLSYIRGPAATLSKQTIPEVLRATAARIPDRDALLVRHQDIRLTYTALVNEVERVARGLAG